MSHNTLANYYMSIFAMVQHHKYSIDEVENMLPYERDIFVEMLISYLEKEKEELQKG